MNILTIDDFFLRLYVKKYLEEKIGFTQKTRLLPNSLYFLGISDIIWFVNKQIRDKSSLLNTLHSNSRHMIRGSIVKLKGKCGKCEFRKVCGGCRARAFEATGDFLAEEPLCSYQPISIQN